MRRNHVGGYRGRKTGRDFLKYIILALALVVAVLAGLLLFGGEKPPRQEQEQQGQQQEQMPTQPEQPSEQPTEPVTEPEPEPVYMAAIGVDTAQVLDGSWKAAMEQAGANAVVLDMKPDNGPLNWTTAQQLSISAGAQNNTEGLNDRLRQLNAGEVYTVARMSCFRDELTANIYECCIHSNSGYRWQDFGKVHWVSPAHSGVQDNLVGLAVELAELGFDEILLTHCGYPSAEQGRLDRIRVDEAYPAGMLNQVITPFLSGVKAALEPYEVRLSVRAQTAELKGETAHTGLTMKNVLSSCDRIWVTQEEWDTCAVAALAADPELDPARLLVSVQSEPGETEVSWAILN